MPAALKDEFVLWPEHYGVVELFIACTTQWRCASAGMSLITLGFDYTGIESALRMSGTKKKHWPQLFKDLGVMEKAAVTVLNAADDGWD
jgi:hypothetical protein